MVLKLCSTIGGGCPFESDQRRAIGRTNDRTNERERASECDPSKDVCPWSWFGLVVGPVIYLPSSSRLDWLNESRNWRGKSVFPHLFLLVLTVFDEGQRTKSLLLDLERLLLVHGTLWTKAIPLNGLWKWKTLRLSTAIISVTIDIFAISP